MNNIPVCEPLLSGNELQYVLDAVSTGWISSSGTYVHKFENSFASYCDSKYGVSVCNGTVALHLALIAIGIKKGDEVIIPSFTMVASAFAVCYLGAIPVFVDVKKDTWNIDPSKISEKITHKTKAIMVVSIFGLPCEMNKIYEIAKKYNLKILEDAAESHGSEYKGKKTGSLADITAFSFFANKNLTTGEGGMVVTNDKKLYNNCLYYRNMCFSLDGNRNYIHQDIGYNYRLSNVLAAIGLAQVEKADFYRKKRISQGRLYEKKLQKVKGIVFQAKNKESKSVYWMNGIVIDAKVYGHTRDELIHYLSSKGVDTRLFFVGMHRQPSLLKYRGTNDNTFPVTNWLSENGLYLPSGSGLGSKKINYICQQIIDFQKK